LVHTVATLPEGDDPELAALRRAEVERAHELQSDGTLVALWREAGRLASFGIWRGTDVEHVRALVASLPLHRYMTVSITELHRHPNAISAFPFDDPDAAAETA
jgi:muconolactone D-isomerase